MFGTHKIKLDKQLFDKLAAAAEKEGYASTEEFILHVLQRQVADQQEISDQEQAERQLRGLGYLE